MNTLTEKYTKFELHSRSPEGEWRRATARKTESEREARDAFKTYIAEQRKTNRSLQGFLPSELCRTDVAYRIVRCECEVLETI